MLPTRQTDWKTKQKFPVNGWFKCVGQYNSIRKTEFANSCYDIKQTHQARYSFPFQISWVVFQLPSACLSSRLRYLAVLTNFSPPCLGVRMTFANPLP